MTVENIKSKTDELPHLLRKRVKSARSSLSIAAGLASVSWAKMFVENERESLENHPHAVNLLEPKKWFASVDELSRLALHTNDEACFKAINLLVFDLKERRGWLSAWANEVGLKRIAEAIPRLLERDGSGLYVQEAKTYAWESDEQHVWTVRFLDDVKKLIQNCATNESQDAKEKAWKRAMFRSPNREGGINYTNAANPPWWGRFLTGSGKAGAVGRSWFAHELSEVGAGELLWEDARRSPRGSQEYASPWKVVQAQDYKLAWEEKKPAEALDWTNACVRAYVSRDRTVPITKRAAEDFARVFKLSLSSAQQEAIVQSSFGMALLAFQNELLFHDTAFRSKWQGLGWNAAMGLSEFTYVKQWSEAFHTVAKKLSQEDWENAWKPFDEAASAIDGSLHNPLSQFFIGVVWPSSSNSNLDIPSLKQGLRTFKETWVHDRERALLKERIVQPPEVEHSRHAL